MTCLWPGLPRLWVCGDLGALPVAMTFTVLLNVTIVATFLWPWQLPLILMILLWAAVITIWTSSFWSTWRRFPEPPKEHATIYEDLFLRAQTEYLRGEHFAAESALGRLLKRRPQDVEARLLLASVYRRTARLDQARKQLRRLARTGGAKWALEVSRELQLLDEIEARPNKEVA
ncbi:MAG: tetratricopeptide repeat protein [Planctomycetales bacterium]|nr:tetratricopeptide repeat protein [Planctomycetales bacterium]